MLVAIEGCDGCGKTSVVQAVSEALGAESMHFPNDSAVTGPLIRQYLKRRWWVEFYGAVTDTNASALVFQALQVANRMEVMPRLTLAMGSETDHLVLSRYWQSGWVYGQLDGLDPDFLEQLHVAMAQPDIHILLDLPAEEAVARRAKRDGQRDPERYEKDVSYTTRVAQLYRTLWRSRQLGEARHDTSEWYVVNAMRPIEEVIAEVVEICRHG